MPTKRVGEPLEPLMPLASLENSPVGDDIGEATGGIPVEERFSTWFLYWMHTASIQWVAPASHLIEVVNELITSRIGAGFMLRSLGHLKIDILVHCGIKRACADLPNTEAPSDSEGRVINKAHGCCLNFNAFLGRTWKQVTIPSIPVDKRMRIPIERINVFLVRTR